METHRIWALRAGGYLLIIGTLLLLVAAVRFFWFQRGIGLVAPACTILAAGVASIVGTLGIVSWAEQRQRDREAKEYAHREAVYENITQFMVARFVGQGYDAALDAKLRATAALWGSQTTMERLGDWQSSLTQILAKASEYTENAENVMSRGVALNDAEQREVLSNLGLAIQAMRDDLATETNQQANVQSILRSIFNQGFPEDIGVKNAKE